MSEKQFQIIHLGNPYEFVVKDNTTNKTYGPFEGDEKSMSDLLNEQQEKITELEIELTDCKNRKEQSEYKNTKLIAKIDFLERVIDGDV